MNIRLAFAFLALAASANFARAAEITFNFSDPSSPLFFSSGGVPQLSNQIIRLSDVTCSLTIGNPPPSCGSLDTRGPADEAGFAAAFFLDADFGYYFNLISFSFDESNPGDAGQSPTGFRVEVLGLASIFTGALSPDATGFTTHSFSLADNPFAQDLNSTQFLFFAYGGPDSGPLTPWYLDNITVDFEQSTGPEPGTFLMVALAGIGLAGVLLRRSRRL